MADRLLEPERLTTLLSSLAGRRAEKAAAVDRRLAALAREAEEADERLRRIYKLVEDGRDEVDDILRARIADLKQARAKAQAALERARSATRSVEDVEPHRRRALHANHAREAHDRRGPLPQGLSGRRSSTASRSMTARCGSWAARTCWNKPSWPAGKTRPVFIVLYRSGEPGRTRTCATRRSRRASNALPCRSANHPCLEPSG